MSKSELAPFPTLGHLKSITIVAHPQISIKIDGQFLNRLTFSEQLCVART